MCTFADQRTVLVCDVAIAAVRQELQRGLQASDVQYTVVEGQGTLVQAAARVDAEQFEARVRTAIAHAQTTG